MHLWPNKLYVARQNAHIGKQVIHLVAQTPEGCKGRAHLLAPHKHNPAGCVQAAKGPNFIGGNSPVVGVGDHAAAARAAQRSTAGKRFRQYGPRSGCVQVASQRLLASVPRPARSCGLDQQQNIPPAQGSPAPGCRRGAASSSISSTTTPGSPTAHLRLNTPLMCCCGQSPFSSYIAAAQHSTARLASAPAWQQQRAGICCHFCGQPALLASMQRQ